MTQTSLQNVRSNFGGRGIKILDQKGREWRVYPYTWQTGVILAMPQYKDWRDGWKEFNTYAEVKAFFAQ